jgi:protein TonB
MLRPGAVMTFGAKPMGPPPLRPRPPARGDTAFAVGSRALITPSGTSSSDVQLLDEDGMPTALRLPVDATVVITAWRPRRSAPPRYRVCTSDQVEGWVDAANLRRLPPPPPPVPMAMPEPPKPAVTKTPPKPAAKSASMKPAAKVVAKPVPAAKSAAPSAAHKTARPPSQPTARPRQAKAKPPVKPKRSRPTSKRAR